MLANYNYCDWMQYINLQMPVGKMYHCPKRGRGVHVRASELKNIVIRDDCSYQRLLDKCVREMYSIEEQEKASFYIADKGGIPIWTSDKIEVDIEGTGHTTEEREWTLRQYILLSGIKYPSRAKLYCVRKGLLWLV